MNPSTPRAPDGPVAVVLVNWKGAGDTLETLVSLDAVTGVALRPIVVDNGSPDDSVARLRAARPNLELVETGQNLGFAGGNLAGIRHALADPAVAWVLLLNTDVDVAPDFLTPLLAACADPTVGAAGPKIFYADPADRLWAAGGRLRVRETVTEEWGRGELDGPRWNTARDVTYLTTCCLLIPRDSLERVGPLDPAYFINVDDADWCRRALGAGYRLRYVPESVIWHKVAASTGGHYTPLKTFHTGRSNAIYARRHLGGLGLLGFLLANLATLPLAFLREARRGNSKAVVSKLRGVWRGLRDPLAPVPPVDFFAVAQVADSALSPTIPAMKPRTAFGQHTLPRESYASDEVFALESERIFGRSWLLAGHVSELPTPGSYITFAVGRESVLLVRDAAGTVRAFHNLCRHRGSRLCAGHRGEAAHGLQCPYHAWTYGLDGALRAAPAMTDVAGFALGDWGLLPVALTEWNGLLFINLADDPVPFFDALPGLEGRFGEYRLPELVSVHQKVYEVEANWKLIFHNYSECYHCPLAHPHLNKLTPYKNTENDLDEGPVLGGPMWMANSDGSMTIGGDRCAPPFPGLSDEQRGRVYYYTLFAAGFLSFHPDYVLVHRAVPLSKDHTRVFCDWYFLPAAIAAPGFDPQPAIDFWDLTNRQDWELCKNAHAGVTSNAWVPGPYSDLESQLAAFDRQYRAALDRESPPSARRRAG